MHPFRRSRPRAESVECISMAQELAAVELYGSELGERSEADYMFKEQKEIDMDAFHDRYFSKLELGCSTDAASYFDRLSDRFGYACRKEGSPTPETPGPEETSV